MAASKLGSFTLLLLLFCGIVVEVKEANAAAKMEACPRNCDGRAWVLLCPKDEDSKTNEDGQLCTNCCVAASMGCTLIDMIGTAFCQEEPSIVLP